jgi:hypothetical protein
MRIEITPGFRHSFPGGVSGGLVVRECSSRSRASAIPRYAVRTCGDWRLR